MPELTEFSPDTTPALGDPGDDTARRYRYQWTFAGIVCCMLLDNTRGISEVFCEHHEDVLIKHSDATFTGLQVKTRASNQDVWKTNDEAVKNSCARFAKLEATFPGRFRRFRFVTNHPLYASGNGHDLNHVLSTIKTADAIGDVTGTYLAFLTGIASLAGCSSDIAFSALAKTYARDDLPKLSDIEQRLVATLCLPSSWSGAEDRSYASVIRAARHLVDECGRASSLAHENVLPAYLSVVENPEALETKARLEGKRMTLSRVAAILDSGLNEIAPLDGDPESGSIPGAGSPALLRKKLDAGGFSAVSRNSAEDLRDKADYLGMVWASKYGDTKGLQRYGHVRSLVLSDAARAFEAVKTEGKPFGLQMLAALRNSIQSRRAAGTQLYDCSDEHLEGLAYSMTSECQVQWSIDRPWEVE